MNMETLCEFAKLALWAGCLLAVVPCATGANAGESLPWEKLPPIPDPEGFAAAFAGVSNGALIVAGGANIAGEKWGETFRKQWHDSVFVLEKPDGEWRSGFRLPRALGYGVSVTTERGVVCIGGSDSQRHHADVFLLEWRDGRVVMTALPSLPKPCANACGALVGKVIYVAGGIEKPDATVAVMGMLGVEVSPARLPHDNPTPRQSARLRTALETMGFFDWIKN